MREIKFRAWDSYYKFMTNKVLVGDLKEQTNLIWIEPSMVDYECEPHWMSFDENGVIELMQYTGLKDKNGVEIYEGDIIYHSGLGNSVIEYEDNSFVANVVGTLNLSDARFGSYNYRDFKSNIVSHEVIGNIYENPELLEE